MKVKVNQILTIIIIYTLSIFSVSVLAQDLSSEPKIDTVKEMIQKEYEKKWYNQVNFSGFVDVYYNYTMNNSQGAQVNHAGTMHKYNKQFAVSSVELDIEKVPEKKSPWGFRIDFQNGQNNAFQENSSYVSNSIFNMNMLQQAYVSLYFPIYKGIQFDMGKMTSHAEVDAIESKDNYTYTMGYLSYNIPFIATGARAKATLSDSWAFTLYFYDNVTGTGYINYNKRNTNAQEFLADTNQHYYNVGSTKAQTVGTKLEGDVVKEKVSMSWNTIYGNEYANGRVDNQTYYYNQIANAPTPSSPGYKIKYDYYFINNIYFTFHLLERLSFIIDWSFYQKSGGMAANSGAYIKEGIPQGTIPGLNVSLGRDGNKVKRINNTYAFFLQYFFTKEMGLGLRYEYIDDSRYGGPYASNPPRAGITPQYRYDLLTLDQYGLRASGNLGQVRTFTITPTYIYSEHIIVKLDFRRDWGMGDQFIDERGRPCSYQNGVILGLVAKF